MRWILIIPSLLLFIIVPRVSMAQSPVCPAGMVCISQDAANQAAENKRELDAMRAKVIVLQEALDKKDVSIAELKAAHETDKAALKDAMHKTELDLALKTGQLIGAESSVVRLTAEVEFLNNHGRKRCAGIICIQ